MSAALLIVRLLVGLGQAAHGSQKLFGWFGGHGLSGTGRFFENLGFRPGRPFALIAGLGEFGGGLLVALGLGGAIGPALVVCTMIVAILTVHIGKGFFNEKGGWELPAVYLAGALALAFAGTGRLSLDAALGISLLNDPVRVWVVIGAAVVVALVTVAIRRPSS